VEANATKADRTGTIAVGGATFTVTQRAPGSGLRELWAVGGNLSGQLGTGRVLDRAAPCRVARDVRTAAAGFCRSLFVKADGTLWAVGNNSFGSLGDGTATDRNTPTQVAAGVQTVSAGNSHSLFIKTDGSLWAMGDNSYGQLADGTATDRSTPVQIASHVVSASAGHGHTLFVAEGDMRIPVTIQTQPVSAIATAAGGRATISVSAAGTGTLTYQWQRNGVDIPGATAATLTLPSTQAFHAGSYTCVITGSNGMAATTETATVTVSAPAPSDARPMNMSTRALCLTGDDVLIPGFVVDGTGTKRLLMRAVGPELGGFGLATFLPDPQMRLEQRQPGQSWLTLAQNDDWEGNANAADIPPQAALLGAFPLDSGSKSAALLMDVPAGVYTIVAGGKPSAGSGQEDTGVAMVELYDADPTSATARLINISNRGYVGTGADIMIPGFVYLVP
jgi:hypothetical protein